MLKGQIPYPKEAIVVGRNPPPVSLGQVDQLGLVGRSFTVEAWVLPTESSDVTILGTEKRDNGASLHIVIRGGYPQLNFWNADLISPVPLALNVWNHVAFAYSLERFQQLIYVNGSLAATSSSDRRLSGSSRLFFGRQGHNLGILIKSHGLEGAVTEFRLWDHERTPREIFCLAHVSIGDYIKAENRGSYGLRLATEYSPSGGVSIVDKVISRTLLAAERPQGSAKIGFDAFAAVPFSRDGGYLHQYAKPPLLPALDPPARPGLGVVVTPLSSDLLELVERSATHVGLPKLAIDDIAPRMQRFYREGKGCDVAILLSSMAVAPSAAVSPRTPAGSASSASTSAASVSPRAMTGMASLSMHSMRHSLGEVTYPDTHSPHRQKQLGQGQQDDSIQRSHSDRHVGTQAPQQQQPQQLGFEVLRAHSLVLALASEVLADLLWKEREEGDDGEQVTVGVGDHIDSISSQQQLQQQPQQHDGSDDPSPVAAVSTTARSRNSNSGAGSGGLGEKSIAELMDMPSPTPSSHSGSSGSSASVAAGGGGGAGSPLGRSSNSGSGNGGGAGSPPHSPPLSRSLSYFPPGAVSTQQQQTGSPRLSSAQPHITSPGGVGGGVVGRSVSGPATLAVSGMQSQQQLSFQLNSRASTSSSSDRSIGAALPPPAATASSWSLSESESFDTPPAVASVESDLVAIQGRYSRLPSGRAELMHVLDLRSSMSASRTTLTAALLGSIGRSSSSLLPGFQAAPNMGSIGRSSSSSGSGSLSLLWPSAGDSLHTLLDSEYAAPVVRALLDFLYGEPLSTAISRAKVTSFQLFTLALALHMDSACACALWYFIRNSDVRDGTVLTQVVLAVMSFEQRFMGKTQLGPSGEGQLQLGISDGAARPFKSGLGGRWRDMMREVIVRTRVAVLLGARANFSAYASDMALVHRIVNWAYTG